MLPRRPTRGAALAAMLLVLAPVGSAQGRSADERAPVRASGPAPVPPPTLVERGEGELPLPVPQGEELVFRARVKWGPVDARVGTITLSAGVEPYRASILFGGRENQPTRNTAWVRAVARGKNMGYEMDSTIEARYQPHPWPALVYTFDQRGTEKRRREILAGTRDGTSVRQYRSDTTRGAPRGSRIWRTPQQAPAPLGAVDSLSAVYLIRAMIEAQHPEIEFPMLDKDRIWWVHAELGDAQRIETHAGAFSARPVRLASTRLDPERYAEQIAEQMRPDAPDPDFEGPFGIRGDIRLWVEENTGVPVWIEGDLPIGVITLQLDIRLESFRGTPTGFRPIGRE
jgi:hypothetical protein